MSSNQICSRCIYDSSVDGISFDATGICSYCRRADLLGQEFGTGTQLGVDLFSKIVREMKNVNQRSKYDCVVGVSGGTDSSYLLHLMVREYGLRVLAVHYDNTWNSAIATTNIARMIQPLSIDLYTHVVNNHEADDIIRSFFLAGVAEIDAASDLGYAYLLRQVARKFRVRHIIEGHSYTAEGITPLSNNYVDGRYIASIHREFGSRPIETYPLMTLTRFIKSAAFSKVRFVRPLWYLDYSKEAARRVLQAEYDWQYYSGHHLENRIAAFSHLVYYPEKFGVDLRVNSLAAEVRHGLRTRTQAMRELSAPVTPEPGLVDYFRRRLGISVIEYQEIMSQTPKYSSDFETYKRAFEILEPLFRLLVKYERVPKSFYMKYCFPRQT
jgi:hypothetical protein